MFKSFVNRSQASKNKPSWDRNPGMYRTESQISWDSFRQAPRLWVHMVQEPGVRDRSTGDLDTAGECQSWSRSCCCWLICATCWVCVSMCVCVCMHTHIKWGKGQETGFQVFTGARNLIASGWTLLPTEAGLDLQCDLSYMWNCSFILSCLCLRHLPISTIYNLLWNNISKYVSSKFFSSVLVFPYLLRPTYNPILFTQPGSHK